jgi:glucose-6-phosphate 1-dehydrogenase
MSPYWVNAPDAHGPGAEGAAGDPERGSAGTALVVFGATGDLAGRKLYPALASLALRDQLPSELTVVGVARTVMSDEDFTGVVEDSIDKALGGDATAGIEALHRLGLVCRYVVGQADEAPTFELLRDTLLGTAHSGGSSSPEDGARVPSCLFYLATIPRLFAPIAAGLDQAGLAQEPPGIFRRFVVEKPFGHDLESARELDRDLHAHFRESQIFRIDHYLAKETVQNILALRFTNTIFEPVWNRRYVDHVQITVAEQLGVEHRGTFYEQAGALRDIVQNHVMQVLSLTAMEPPARFTADPIRDEKVKLFGCVHPLERETLYERVVRAQYGPGELDGVEVPGYREEEGVAPDSQTETYVAIRLEIDNWRWAGVPFYIRTGKRLAKRVTEVALRFKEVPFLPLPPDARDTLEPNTLVLRIQPDEGVEISFAAKVPGQRFAVRTVPLDFSYRQRFEEKSPDAYERVLHDAMMGDATLFIRADEVEECWRIVQPLVDSFSDGDLPLASYPAGSWGPHEADVLIAACGDEWREP